MPAGIRVDEFWPHSSQVQALEAGPRWSWATPLQVFIHCTAETSAVQWVWNRAGTKGVLGRTAAAVTRSSTQ